MPAPAIIRVIVALSLPALPACVPIHIDQERFHEPNVVRGHLPQDRDSLARRNEAMLKQPLPTRPTNPPQGTPPDPDAPHPGRLYDSALDPDRVPAPGRYAKDQVRFSEEWDFNRGSTKLPPRHCVAMSGGGIRSAAFNIGVLSALHQNGMLDRADILSAVSGGAYALSWYYAQHYNDAAGPHDPARRAALDAEMMQLGSKHQHFLARNARIFNTAGYAAVGVANTAMIPFNFLVNGIFGWHLNTTPGRSVYEARLRKIFHAEPHFREKAHEEPQDIPIGQLAVVAKQRGLPYFIVNTTALVEDSSEYLGAPLYNRIYEFTPGFFGADALGRFRYDDTRPRYPVSFSRAVSISGAALDGAKLVSGSSQRTLWSLLNQDLGYYVNNPALSSDARVKHRALPFPFYYFHHYPRHLDGTDIYLSDGGHSENLGAYGLVRRLCEHIVVVDAEHDPDYEFESYFVLKQALRRDLHVELRVPSIEALASDEWTLREGRIDRAIRSGGEIDASQHPPRTNLPPLKTFDILESTRWKAVAARPVMSGTIASLPYPGRGDVLGVTYLKLAYHADEGRCEAVKKYFSCCTSPGGASDGCLMRLEDAGAGNDHCVANAASEGLRWMVDDQVKVDYPRLYHCQTRDTAELRTSRYTNLSHFPQEPTTDQNFTELQFKAYRQLGYDTAIRNIRGWPNR